MSLTATDLFAGAGGSTIGAEEAGVEVKLAVNHWRLAVDVHQANHPDADHDCADISQVDPRRYPSTELLLGSPECTWHSPASGRQRDAAQADLFGRKPLPPEAGQRSRATMWDIPRFAEYHRYPIVLVENVVEAIQKWQPARAWLMAMDSLGYRHEVISHNAMHAQAYGLPAPQSRDRVYVAFWDRRLPRPDWDSVQRPTAYCPRCDTITEAAKAWKQRKDGPPMAGKYRTQYLYACTTCGTIVEPGWLPAAAAIDWSLPAQRIGDRERPLSDKTMARIREAIRRYGSTRENLGIVVEAAGNTWDMASGSNNNYLRAWPTSEPLKTIHTTPTKALLVPYYGASRGGQDVSEPMPTVTTVERHALVMLRGQNRPKLPSEPLDTIAAGGNHHALVNLDKAVEDARFRMLEPHEYAAGMAFPRDYIWQGTKRERVKMMGNGNPPPVERDLVTVAREALERAA